MVKTALHDTCAAILSRHAAKPPQINIFTVTLGPLELCTGSMVSTHLAPRSPGSIIVWEAPRKSPTCVGSDKAGSQYCQCCFHRGQKRARGTSTVRKNHEWLGRARRLREKRSWRPTWLSNTPPPVGLRCAMLSNTPLPVGRLFLGWPPWQMRKSERLFALCHGL